MFIIKVQVIAIYEVKLPMFCIWLTGGTVNYHTYFSKKTLMYVTYTCVRVYECVHTHPI